MSLLLLPRKNNPIACFAKFANCVFQFTSGRAVVVIVVILILLLLLLLLLLLYRPTYSGSLGEDPAEEKLGDAEIDGSTAVVVVVVVV